MQKGIKNVVFLERIIDGKNKKGDGWIFCIEYEVMRGNYSKSRLKVH